MLASTSPSVSWVYYNGTYVWDYTAYEQAHPDNWNSGLSSNYASSAIKCLTGSKCIQQTPTAANGIWIPYPANPNAPNPNDTVNKPFGIGINIIGYDYFTVAINPTQAGFSPIIYIDYAVPGKVDQTGGCIGLSGAANNYSFGGNHCAHPSSLGAWGPDPMIPGQWNVYNVPISAFNIGTILSETHGWIYKFFIQEQATNGANDQVYYLDQVGFSTAPLGAGTVTTTPTATSGTMIPPATQIIDDSKNVWTVTSGVIYKNGKTAGYSADVIVLLYQNGVIYQENSSKLWWSWNGTTWVSTIDPITTSAPTPTATPKSTATPAPTAKPTATPQPTVAPTPTPTPVAGAPGLPDAPTIFSTNGVGKVSGVYPAMNGAYVLFSPPSNAASLSAGGTPIQSYIATAYNSSGVAVATATSSLNTSVNAVSARVDFRGSLPSSGGSYTIKVAATNAKGTGPQSAASTPVTPNPYADYYLYSGTANGLSSAWGNYNGSVNMLSKGHVLSGESVSMEITGGTGDPWFIGYWMNPLAGGGYAGMFDLGQYEYVVMKVFPVDQATANAINVGFAYEEFIFGICGAGSAGGTCFDPTQDFKAGSLLTGGGLGNSPRIATVNPSLPYNSVTANTATSISSGGGQSFSAGTPYMWSVQDVRSVPITTPLTTTYGTLTPGVWNQMKIPISVLDNLHKGFTQELGISLSNGGTAVYITDVGFTSD